MYSLFIFFKESHIFKILGTLTTLLYSIFFNTLSTEKPPYKIQDIDLYNEIVKMDNIYFTAYNNCDMDTQKEILAEDVEFFHDKEGLQTDKRKLLKALDENICNKVSRTLIKGSIEVYPINNYGAIEIGYHKFFNKEEPNAIINPSKFIVTWKKEDEKWLIKKVISLH